jgi:uncharacterized membrane protein YdjX (TVP38/TMEM64 family)
MSESKTNPNEASAVDKSPSGKTSRGGAIRLGVFLAVVAAAGFAYWQFGGSLNLSSLAAHEQQLQKYRAASPFIVFAVAFAIYVAVTGLSIPGAAGLTLAYGWFFGFVNTVLLVSFASTLGASIAFVLSRYIFGTSLQEKFKDRLASFNQALGKDGAFYLFTLRLIPVVPFFVINVVMGLTRLPLKTFWLVSQLGMLPGTMVYVYAGSSVPDLQTLNENGLSGIISPKLFVAFAVLGLLPLVLKKAIQWLKPSSQQ